MKDDTSTQTRESGPSPNEFERDKPGTNARSDAEAAIEELRHRGGMFVDAVRATRMAMALTDPSLPGNPIVFANQAFLDLSGYSMEEVLGQQPFFMNGPDTDPEDVKRFRKILESDADGVVETVQYAKDGRRFVATVLLSAFKDDAGKTLHHFLSWADVSRRADAEHEASDLRRAQAALVASESKYRTLFQSIDEGFCLLEFVGDLGRSSDLRFLEVNEAFERQTGLTDVVGKLRSEVSPDTEDYWNQTYAEVARTGEAKRVESYHEQTGRWYDVFIAPVGGAGSRQICLVFKDTTEAREREDHQRFLLALGDAMRAEYSAQAIIEAAARLLAERLKPSRVLLAEFDEANGFVEVFHAWLADGATPFPTIVRQEDFAGPILDDLRAGRTMRVDDSGEPPFERADFAALAEVGIKAALSVPLIIGGRLVATLSVHQHEPRRWTDAEVALLQEVAERLWADVVRARAEEALRESEARLTRALDAGELGAWELDLRTLSAWRSPQHDRIFGYDTLLPEWSYDTFLDHLVPEDRTAVDERFQDAIATNGAWDFECRIRRADGQIRWIWAQGRIDAGEGGEARRMKGTVRDITKNKLAEEALRESERLQSALLEVLPLGVGLVDMEGRVLLSNPEWTRFLPTGTIPSHDKERGSRWRSWDSEGQLVDPSRYPGARALCGETINPPMEFLYTDDDGRETWTSVASVPVTDAAGNVTGAVSIIQDIDASKRAAQALAASEERLKRVLETPAVGVLFFDHSGVLIDANEAFLAMSGYSREQIERGELSWQIMTPQEWHAASLKEMKKLQTTGQLGPYEKQYLLADGSCRWMMFAARDLGDGTIVEFCFDITAKRQAENALRESEERLRQFGEASQDVLWMRDAATLQWTYLTPAFEAIYGLSRKEAQSGDDYRNWLDLVVPEDREHAAREIERVRSGEQVSFDYRIKRRSDGAIRWVRNTDFPITDSMGKVVMIGGVGHDLTELRQSGERARLLLAELQHRVRNIMAMIRSVARRTGESTETVEDYVQHLEGRISAMARTQALLTRDVAAVVDLENLILDELNMQAAEPDQYSVRGPDVSLPPKAAEVLGLAVHELATNSVKYGALSGKDGRIDVRWALLDGDGTPQLSLIWSELGLALRNEDRRSGFGTELITQRVPYELHGAGTMEFMPTGMVATIEFPLANMASILQTDEGVTSP